jgi:hypothetical protein
MNADTPQGGYSDRKNRSLRVEAVGDFFRGEIIPRIRISGRWLQRAGFKPGHRVQLVIEGPGAISLRFVAELKEVAE